MNLLRYMQGKRMDSSKFIISKRRWGKVNVHHHLCWLEENWWQRTWEGSRYPMPVSLLSLLVIYAFSHYWTIIETKLFYFFINDVYNFQKLFRVSRMGALPYRGTSKLGEMCTSENHKVPQRRIPTSYDQGKTTSGTNTHWWSTGQESVFQRGPWRYWWTTNYETPMWSCSKEVQEHPGMHY